MCIYMVSLYPCVDGLGKRLVHGLAGVNTAVTITAATAVWTMLPGTYVLMYIHVETHKPVLRPAC